MSKQKHRHRTQQRVRITQRHGRRSFRYHVPPEVADRLPPGATVTLVSLTRAEVFDLARQVEPEVTRWLTEKRAKNALEALLLMGHAIYALLQPPELPVPYKELLTIVDMLAHSYDFAPSWPYTREQMKAAMTLGHPDHRIQVPDEHILVVAEEVESRLLVQMADEGVVLRDATQAGMLVVTMTHKVLFEESSVFGADEHEMYHIARVLVARHTFHPQWPYRHEVKGALAEVFHLPEM